MNPALLLPFLLGAVDLKPSENFVMNPSFEDDRDRSGGPDGWEGMAYDSPAQMTWDDSETRSGRRSVRIADSARDGDQKDWKRCTGRWVAIPRPIEPGSEYTLEAWVKTREVTGQAYAHLAWHDQTRWLGEVPTEKISGTRDWTKISVVAKAPAGADGVVVSMNLARSKGAAWFDDVRVSGKSDEPPAVEYVFSDTRDWFPFSFPLDDTNLDSIDLSGFLDAPAGRHGFIMSRPDGHLYFANGRRARFIGTNVGGRSCAPEKNQATQMAARLAKYGMNMLRLHAFDGSYGGLIDYGKGTSQQFDAAALDRMDFFIAELKRHGIYVYLDLLDYRMFRTADGVAHGDEFTHNWDGSMKGASIFDARMIELQKDYATRLLTHLNPYTGLRYVDDPAMAIIEITNENSIFYFLRSRGLSLPYYREALARQWNQWLAMRYGSRAALSKAWADEDGVSALGDAEDPASSSVAFPFGKALILDDVLEGKLQDRELAVARISDVLRFLRDVQARYYETMREHLKTIGVRVPVAGTNQMFFHADTRLNADGFGIMSRNQYWRHPNVHAKPFAKFFNEPMIRVDLATERNPLAVIATTSVAGKPQAVAEYNFPWPNEYRCEGWLLSAAYACLQDWDVFLYFNYSPEGERLSMFPSQSDPARWGEVPAAATLFHRRDVARARNEIHVLRPSSALFAPRPDTPESRHSEFNFLIFLSKVRNAFFDDVYSGGADVALACGSAAKAAVTEGIKAIRFEAEPWREWLMPQFVRAAQASGVAGYDRMEADAMRFDSDTGELSLDYKRGLFTIRTAHTKAAVGFLAEAGPVDLGEMRVESKTEFSAISATSLDGKKIGESRRLLLTAVGRAENTNQAYWPPDEKAPARNRQQWMVSAGGISPVIVEPVRATIVLPIAPDAVVYPLDATGRRKASLPVVAEGNRLRVDLAGAKSIWCEVVAGEAR